MYSNSSVFGTGRRYSKKKKKKMCIYFNNKTCAQSKVGRRKRVLCLIIIIIITVDSSNIDLLFRRGIIVSDGYEAASANLIGCTRVLVLECKIYSRTRNGYDGNNWKLFDKRPRFDTRQYIWRSDGTNNDNISHYFQCELLLNDSGQKKKNIFITSVTEIEIDS